MGGGSELDHSWASVDEFVGWIGARGKLVCGQIKHFPYALDECSILRKNARNDSSNVISARCAAVGIFDHNHRSCEFAAVNRERSRSIDWFGCNKEGTAARAIDAKTMPAARCERAVIPRSFVVREQLGGLRSCRNRNSRARWRFYRSDLAVRRASDEGHGNRGRLR